MNDVNRAVRLISLARDKNERAKVLDASGIFGNRVEAAVLRSEATKMLEEAVHLYNPEEYEL